jgi:hypothetical protein
MKYRTLQGAGYAAVLSIFLCACSPSPEGGDTGADSQDLVDGRTLFDGESFDGWEGNMDMFRVEDGAIVAGTLDEPIPNNEFLCTRSDYDDFELRLEFRLLGGEAANAGVQFRSQRIPDHHEVIGYQADMGDGWWGALYDESRRNRILAEPDSAGVAEALVREDWNEYVIRAEGPRIRLAINGYETIDYTEPEDDIPQTGKICVQIHSGPPSEAWYRNISIAEASSATTP